MDNKTINNDIESQRFDMPASVTVNEVEYVFALLGQIALENGQPLIIGSSSNEVITTPGIQLLISLNKKIESTGGKLIFDQPSKSLSQAFETLGIKSLLTKAE